MDHGLLVSDNRLWNTGNNATKSANRSQVMYPDGSRIMLIFYDIKIQLRWVLVESALRNRTTQRKKARWTKDVMKVADSTWISIVVAYYVQQ